MSSLSSSLFSSRFFISLFRYLIPFNRQAPVLLLIRRTAFKHWWLLVVNIVSSMVEALTEGATLAVIFLAVDTLTAPGNDSIKLTSIPFLDLLPGSSSIAIEIPTLVLFIGLLVLAVGLQFLQSVCRLVNTMTKGYFSAECTTAVIERVHSQALFFDFSCASNYKVGELVDQALLAPPAIRTSIDLFGRFIVDVLLAITYIVVLANISPWLLIAVILIGSLVALIQKHLLPRIRDASKRITESQNEVTSCIAQDFQALRLLHTYGQLEEAVFHLKSLTNELKFQLRKQARRTSFVQPISTFLPILAFAIVAASSVLVFSGRDSGVLPSLVTFIIALQRFNFRLANIAQNLNLFAEYMGRLIKLDIFLGKEDKEFRRLDGDLFIGLSRGISFENVTMQYSPNSKKVLDNISFDLPKGSTLALVGPSGAGKSSVADLLTGLYSPVSGEIKIDGKPLGIIDLKSWQKKLGVVSQDTFLLNASIAENVAFGMPYATQSEIKEACRFAQAEEFINALPNGYSTIVGERGYKLSGGQRQRLSLARAILRNPDLLILDEATSALDTQSEKLVQKALEHCSHTNTVLVIAHRLSTIADADCIVVMDKGRIIQCGTHNVLFREPGLYRDLWFQQVKAK